MCPITGFKNKPRHQLASSTLGLRNDTDLVLARAAANGISSGVSDLYERHNRRVYSLCLRITRDQTEAEDLTQEVFIQLLKKIGSFRGESQFTTWLHRLTVNQVLMHLRRSNRHKDELACDFENVKLTIAKNTGPVDRIALDRALATLPPGCRRVFLMFDVAGYNHQEIATMFCCSIGNSKSQLHKARKKLRRLLSDDPQGKVLHLSRAIV
jgi:RNA polymerase sigma-70 factor, ECF subfamily